MHVEERCRPERSAERSTPTIDEAVRLAEVVKPEYRLMVLLGAVAGLRRGECFALRRRDLVEVGGVWSRTSTRLLCS